MAYRVVDLANTGSYYFYPFGYYYHLGALTIVVLRVGINTATGAIIKYRSEDLGQTWVASYLWQTDSAVNPQVGSQRCVSCIMDPGGKLHITFNGFYDENGLSEKMHEIDELSDGTVSVKVYNGLYNSTSFVYLYGDPDVTKPLVELQQISQYTLWVNGSGTFQVPVQDLQWSDDVSVTKYIVKSDSSSTPSLSDPDWVTAGTPPGMLPYISNGTTGSKALYVFARDAQGNISSLNPTGVPHPQFGQGWTYGTYPFTVSLDSDIPLVESFGIGVTPPAYDSPMIIFSSLSDTGGSGVVAYLLDEVDNPNVPVGPPGANDSRWVEDTIVQDQPLTFMAGSPNLRTMVLYAKDGAQNISANTGDTCTENYEYVNDVIYPGVNTFTLVTGNGNSNVASISAFTASTTETGEAIDGYMVTHILNTLPQGTNPKWVAPLANDAGWSSTPPATYTLTGSSESTTYLLLAWARSSSGRVSTISRTPYGSYQCTALYSYVTGGGPP